MAVLATFGRVTAGVQLLVVACLSICLIYLGLSKLRNPSNAVANSSNSSRLTGILFIAFAICIMAIAGFMFYGTMKSKPQQWEGSMRLVAWRGCCDRQPVKTKLAQYTKVDIELLTWLHMTLR
jgi:uncharacterized membrane protein